MKENKREIHDRLYKFALKVLQAVRVLPKTTENLVLIRQVIRSATSVGANALEADGSETKKEFIHRFTISKKEAKETFYWLSLISDYNPSVRDNFVEIIDESEQLVKIISKIIINTENKI